MTDIEEQITPDVNIADQLGVTAEDWGIADIDEPAIEEPKDAGEGEEIDEPEVEIKEEEVQAAEEAETPPVQEPKKPRGVNGRIKELTDKLKEKDLAVDSLKQEMENLKAGFDYLKPKEADAPKKSLDDRLIEAAKTVGDPEFDIDEFTTDAEKRAALIGYENRIEARQQAQLSQLTSIKSDYSAAVAEYQQKDPDIAQGLIAAYNAAVRDEARALMRRYEGLSETDARIHAERALLNEAAGKKDPVYFIANFGKQILDDSGQVLTKPKEKATIDHKNRETVQQKAGKPEIDTAPATKRSAEISKRYEQVAAEW